MASVPHLITRAWSLRPYAGAVAACFVAAWVISLAWWVLLPEARTVVLEVPAGTASAIASGEAVSVIPETLMLRSGDTLVVRNDDVVTHTIGSNWLPPSTTVRIPVDSALLAGPQVICSIHPSGVLGLAAPARPGIATTALPTLLAGVPVSLSALVAMLLVRRLGRDEPVVTV